MDWILSAKRSDREQVYAEAKTIPTLGDAIGPSKGCLVVYALALEGACAFLLGSYHGNGCL